MARQRPSKRRVRPEAEALEGRRLLARSFTGIDLDGDAWVLRLVGPGDLRITDATTGGTTAIDPATPGLIDTITIAGADALTTRLVGTVTQGAAGDGRVEFADIEQLGGTSGRGEPFGIFAIDMPKFFLAQTRTSADGATPPATPAINIPDGVLTLRLGGADTTYTPAGGTPLNQNNTSDTFTVNLGIPRTRGTSIVVDRVITDAQAASTPTGTPTQDGVTFTVAGRLNVFQANTILGNTTFPANGQANGGGTIVQSVPEQNRGITGQIGFARVGGDATNLTVQTNDKISNFYVGGETDNVIVLAPVGLRHALFGKGLDNTTIRADFIESLQANRGAVSSNVTVNRDIGRITFGGDVVNTQVLSGYAQNLQSQVIPTTIPDAQVGGVINNVLIAGDVVDSIFAASVQPFGGQFDVPEALVFPHARITAKVEGTIDNANATPNQPGQAFYAKEVNVLRGPVIPPSVPEQPFPNPNAPPSGHRIVRGLQPGMNNP